MERICLFVSRLGLKLGAVFLQIMWEFIIPPWAQVFSFVYVTRALYNLCGWEADGAVES